jgi:hypothetical protein
MPSDSLGFDEPMPKFPFGSVNATPGALEAITHDEILAALCRHVQGDWGELDDEDKRANELALADGSRLLSIYHTASGVKFYVLTEADRSLTTVLLPEEY